MRKCMLFKCIHTMKTDFEKKKRKKTKTSDETLCIRSLQNWKIGTCAQKRREVFAKVRVASAARAGEIVFPKRLDCINSLNRNLAPPYDDGLIFNPNDRRHARNAIRDFFHSSLSRRYNLLSISPVVNISVAYRTHRPRLSPCKLDSYILSINI